MEAKQGQLTGQDSQEGSDKVWSMARNNWQCAEALQFSRFVRQQLFAILTGEDSGAIELGGGQTGAGEWFTLGGQNQTPLVTGQPFCRETADRGNRDDPRHGEDD